MDWLTDNFITSMYGPHFLFFYGAVIALTLASCWWALRMLDPTTSLPAPSVPSEPDPYEIAYLRGGENQVARVAIVSLTQQGYLRMSEEKTGGSTTEQRIERAPNPPKEGHLPQIEREVLGCFSGSHTAQEVFEDGGVTSQIMYTCTRYERRLQSEQLLMPFEVPRPIKVCGALVIIALGGYKLLAALGNGRSNVWFLIFMGIIALVWLFQICSPRLSSRGQAYLSRLEQAFEGLKDLTPAFARPGFDLKLPLLVGLFGVGVLAGTPFEHFKEMFNQGASGSCGGGCGGGGCGGGCGGCG